jgi:hypothetical protein
MPATSPTCTLVLAFDIAYFASLQRTLEIWSFAIQFGFKYFLINQKWTYDKKEGMSKEAISARKKVRLRLNLIVAPISTRHGDGSTKHDK